MRDMKLPITNNFHLSTAINENDDTVGSNDDAVGDSSIEKRRDTSVNF